MLHVVTNAVSVYENIIYRVYCVLNVAFPYPKELLWVRGKGRRQQLI